MTTRTKLIVISTDGGSREDGNVFYSRYLLASSETLSFGEAIFTDDQHPLRAYRQVISDDDASDARMNAVVKEIESLGYTIMIPEVEYIGVITG